MALLAYIFLSVPKYYIIPIQVTFFGMHYYSHVLPTDYNPYSANLVGRAWPITEFFKSYCSYNSCESFGHASTH